MRLQAFRAGIHPHIPMRRRRVSKQFRDGPRRPYTTVTKILTTAMSRSRRPEPEAGSQWGGALECPRLHDHVPPLGTGRGRWHVAPRCGRACRPRGYQAAIDDVERPHESIPTAGRRVTFPESAVSRNRVTPAQWLTVLGNQRIASVDTFSRILIEPPGRSCHSNHQPGAGVERAAFCLIGGAPATAA
jgi:hypothetical protein